MEISGVAVGLIALSMCLMFLTIITLLVIIYKLKKKNDGSICNELGVKDEPTCGYHRQVSDNVSELKFLNETQFSFDQDKPEVKKEEAKVEDKPEDVKGEVKEDIEMRVPDEPEKKSRHPSISKVLKKPPQIVNKHQMFAMCQEVLSKSKKKETKSLPKVDETHEAKSNLILATNASESGSEQEGEVYDILPAPQPVEKNSDNDEENNVYDVVPTKNIIADENEYIIFVSKNINAQEPCYDNAKAFDDIK